VRIDKRITDRLARLATDLVVLVLVLDVSMGFVDFTHPIVAILFVWASTCGALRQLQAHRAGRPLPSVDSSFKYGWAFVGVVWWGAGMLAGSHVFSQWHAPQMPFAVQSVGAGFLLFAMATPFLRIPHVSRGTFDAYPHAVGSVLLTGSPIIALLVGAWIVVTGRTTWQTLRANRTAAGLAEPLVVGSLAGAVPLAEAA
jgi:hypothetical protein